MTLNLTSNTIAEARWVFTYGRLFPAMDDKDLKTAWQEFCEWACANPDAAAAFEALARRESRMPLDS